MIEQSESIKEIAGALLKAQADLGVVKENATNPFFKSKYADLGEHINTIKPVFQKNGLVITQFLTGTDGCMGVTTMLMHTSGEWMKSTATIPLEQEKGNSIAQTAGKAISYLRRYALAAVANVYSGDDDDGNIATPKESVAKSNAWSPQHVQAVLDSTDKITEKKHAVNWLNLVKPKSVPHITLLMAAYSEQRDVGLEPEAAAEAIQELNV